MTAPLQIGHRHIGAGHPCYIIAEISANHGQDFTQACRIVAAAHAAGADAVKLQTYTADTITLDCRNEYFQVGKGTIWEGRNLHDLYQEAYTPWEWQPKLKAEAERLGLHCFSTPFDFTAVDFLERMQVPAYKIASFELVDIPLIEKVARTGKPLIMSTGMGSRAEITDAVEAFRGAGGRDLILLKCTSAYPADPAEMNLRTIPDLAASFGVAAGISDHTLGPEVPIAAVALGACVIEKHLTLSRAVPGPDSAFSLEPAEFKAMVDGVRLTEKALGKVNYRLSQKEAASQVFRKSLFIVRPVRAGEIFTAENLRSIRPGHGMPPKYLKNLLGRRAKCDLEEGTPLKAEHVGE